MDRGKECLLKNEQAISEGNVTTELFEEIMDKASTSAKEYAIETKGAAGSTEVFAEKQQQAQDELKATATASKGATIAMQALATVGNMFLGWAISEVISLASKAISDYINRLEISKEKLANTESELDSVNAEFEETVSKIKELESLGTPSLTDKEDLERLRAENKELAIRKKYLEDQKKLESEEVVKNAKEKMDYNYGRTTSRESIDAYKAYMDNPTLYTSETDITTIKIAQYEHYQELRKQALEDGDLETIDILDTKLKQLEESLLADRTELQGFKDDLSLTGETSPELDNVINKLEFIDGLLLAPSENLKNFLNSDEISKDIAKLKELASSGELTEIQFKKSFSNINSYLEENNLSFQDLISVLEIYKDELEGLENSTPKWSFTETIKQMETAKEKLSTLDEAYSKLFDGDENTTINTDDFNSILDAFSDVEGLDLEKYLKSLEEADGDIDKVKSSMEGLIGEYLVYGNILNNVTAENKDLVVTMLEEMGVINAEEIMLAALNEEIELVSLQKQFATKTGHELVDATIEEVNQFLQEVKVSKDVEMALAQIKLAKIQLNNIKINTQEDIDNLIALANAAGASDKAIARAKASLQRVQEEKNKEFNGIGDLKRNDYAKVDEVNMELGYFDWETEELDPKMFYPKSPVIEYDPSSTSGTKTNEALQKSAEDLSKAAEDIKDAFEETFDFFEERIKVVNNAIELLETNLENVNGSMAKNKLIDAQIGINAEKVNNYTDAMAMYTQKANEALSKLPADVAEKLKNGAVDLTTFIGDGNKEVVEAVKEYTNWADKVADCKQELAELKQALEDLELSKFQNIMEDFQNIFDIREDKKGTIEKQIALLKEEGELIGESFYTAQKEQTEKQLISLNKQKEELVEQMNSALASGRVKLCPAV